MSASACGTKAFRSITLVLSVVVFVAAAILPAYPATASAQSPPVWFLQKSGTTQKLLAVSFADESHGWAVGDHIILHTSDGGATWNRQAENEGMRGLLDVHCTDPNHCWVIGESVGYRTTDGGHTWHKMQIGARCVFFLDNERGWAGLWPSFDGGITWVEPHIPSDLGGLATTALHISFVDPDYGWATVRIPKPEDGTTRIYVFFTRDGGRNWDTIPMAKTCICGDQFALDWVDRQHGWSQAPLKAIAYTTDGCRTWNLSSTGACQTRAIDFVDRARGWAVGADALTPAVVSTTDGGRQWVPQALPSGLRGILRDVCFTDPSHGWVVGDNGMILAYGERRARPLSLLVDGEPVISEVPPVIIDDRVMVPVRPAIEALGARVDWHAATSTVLIESEGFTGMSDPLAAGANALPGIKILLDGRLVECDVPPSIVDDRTVVPIRFVSQALGAYVEWDEGSRTVIILSAREGLRWYESRTYAVALLHSDEWEAQTAPTGGVRMVKAGQDFIHAETACIGDDPFFPAAVLCESAAKSYAQETEGTWQEIPVTGTPPIGSRSIEAYRKYRVTSDRGTDLVETWSFYERGGLHVLVLAYAADLAGNAPANQEAWAEGIAILESVRVTSDSHRRVDEHFYVEWGVELFLPVGWLKMNEVPRPTVAFSHGPDMALSLVVGNVPPEMTTTGFGAFLKEFLESMRGPGFTLAVGDPKPAGLVGGDGLVLDFVVTLDDETSYGEMYVLVDRDMVLGVTFVCNSRSVLDDRRVRAGLREVLDNMVWRPRPKR